MPPTRCPICGKLVNPAVSKVLPFCSPRCQQIDLRRWLGEEYGLPVERPEEPEQEDSPD
jgi:endogenous inhibitor of DNA gyrase (YacG/DUF329 family)